MEVEHQKPPSKALVVSAFAAVYLIWGATYLAIRYAVETIPPFLMGGGRFLIAGVLLYAVLRFTGTSAPGRIHWKHATVAGVLLLGIGNGGVNWSERRVSSSVAALLIAVTPLWFALLEWLRPNGIRPRAQTIVGIVIGFAGMTLLVFSRGGGPAVAIDPAGVAVLMVASFCWATGSLYVRYTPKPDSALIGVSLQMIMGGAVLLIMGLVAGEAATFEVAKVSSHSAIGFFFLIFIGSFVGFTAYSWLLKVSTPARVSTYAYVNPVIAVFLGWAIGGETLTSQMLMAAAIVLLGVVIITTRKSTPANLSPPRVIESSSALRECP